MNAPARPATATEHLADLASSKKAPGRFVTAGLSCTDDGAGGAGWVAFLAYGPRATAEDPRTYHGNATGEGPDADAAVIDLRRAAEQLPR